MQNIAKQNQIQLQKSHSIPDVTNDLIEKLSNKCKKPIIILIDEYDSPIVEHVEEGTKARANLNVMRSFFTAVNDQRIKLFFVTGVSRFSHVTLFSGMNLEDISMQSTYGNLVGYTEGDVQTLT